jgi:GGDEF domain-containing protein
MLFWLFQQALIKADRALYRAKEAGRDRALGYVK